MHLENKQTKKKLLNKLRENYSKHEFLKSDPIEIVYKYKDPYDQECIALITSLFSYGNVTSIRSFLNKLFLRLGNKPFETLSNQNHFDQLLEGIGSYRFQKEKDISEFFFGISELIRDKNLSDTKFPIFESYFLENGILGFQSKLRSKLRFHSYGLDFLIGKALAKSAHKRYSMFLRWMVLPTFPDFHYYKLLSENDLVLPLDTHIIRMAQILNLSDRKSPDKKLAIEITHSLTEILDEPSVRFDFALSRIGIMEKCRGKFDEKICPQCHLRTVCCFYLSQGS